MYQISVITVDNRRFTFTSIDINNFKEIGRIISSIPDAQFVGKRADNDEMHTYKGWRYVDNLWEVPYHSSDVHFGYGPFKELKPICVCHHENQGQGQPHYTRAELEELLAIAAGPKPPMEIQYHEAYCIGRGGLPEPNYEDMAQKIVEEGSIDTRDLSALKRHHQIGRETRAFVQNAPKVLPWHLRKQ